LNILRDDAAHHFEAAGAEIFRDPWATRNEYIKVLLDENSWSDFLKRHQKRALTSKEENFARNLLEIQRDSMLMFTSCGWFFSDLAGIETIQIMRYAARLLELQKLLGFDTPRTMFLEIMATAKSNKPEKGNGAEIFLKYAESQVPIVT